MLKKGLVYLLSACMVCSLMGCGSASADEQKTTAKDQKVVSFYSWSGNAEQDFEKAIIAQFEKENPDIDIQEVFVPYSEYLSKMNTMAAADSMPDMFKLPEGNVLEWGEKGALLDLKPLYVKAGVDVNATVLPTTIYQTDEKIWGIGGDVATMCLVYNKDLFKAAGVEVPPSDADHPWTWEEYVSNAKKLTKDVNGKTAEEEGFDPSQTTVYGTLMPSRMTSMMPLLYTNGSGIANAEGTELEINSKEGIEVIQSIADLSLKEHCAPSIAMAKGAFSDSSAMLMNGQVAMMIDGSWALCIYANEGFDVGVAQIPAFKEAANMSWTAGICMSPKNSENEEAFRFYQYYTNFNNSIAAANKSEVALGGLPNRLDVFDGGTKEQAWMDTYKKVDETANCQMFKDILQQKNNRQGENVVLKNFPSIVENNIMSALDNVWLGEQTAEEVLNSLDVAADLQGVWK